MIRRRCPLEYKCEYIDSVAFGTADKNTGINQIDTSANVIKITNLSLTFQTGDGPEGRREAMAKMAFFDQYPNLQQLRREARAVMGLKDAEQNPEYKRISVAQANDLFSI